MAVKTRDHAIKVGDRVHFDSDDADTGTVVDVWFGLPRGDGDWSGYRPHWRVLVQWDKNSHTGKTPGELSECGAFATRPSNA